MMATMEAALDERQISDTAQCRKPSRRATEAKSSSVRDSLPPLCYAFLERRPVGQRIVKMYAGVRGYQAANLDASHLTAAAGRVLVDRMNVYLGVTDAQQQAMLAGAAYGYHVPLANPGHPHHRSPRALLD